MNPCRLTACVPVVAIMMNDECGVSEPHDNGALK